MTRGRSLHVNGMDILNAGTRSLENQTPDDAKVTLTNAVQHAGQSVKVWLAAADLEHDIKAKKRVPRKCKRLVLPSLLLLVHHCSV